MTIKKSEVLSVEDLITPEDIKAILKALVSRAKGGDIAAAEEVLSRATQLGIHPFERSEDGLKGAKR